MSALSGTIRTLNGRKSIVDQPRNALVKSFSHKIFKHFLNYKVSQWIEPIGALYSFSVSKSKSAHNMKNPEYCTN